MNQKTLNTDELRSLQGGVYYPKPGDYPGFGPITWPVPPSKPTTPDPVISPIHRPYITGKHS